MNRETKTQGNVIVENINVGDIHYEYSYGFGIECEVITKPIRSEDGQWTWKSKNVKTNKEINYLVTEDLSHYAPKLYDYKAYSKGVKWI